MSFARALGSTALAALLVGGVAAAQSVAKVGSKMSHTFQQPLQNSQGIKSLADLQGKPVVVEFWGTR